MAFDNTPNPLDAAFIQRDDTNQFYEQINISGSNLVIYLDANGLLTADSVNVWTTLYGIGINCLSASVASSSYDSFFSTQSLFSTQSIYATQSLFSTYSLYATNSISSSYGLTASYALTGGTAGGLTPGNTYPITSSWANSASAMPFNGNRSITRTGYSGLNVGGQDVDTFLNNFFFPFVPATISDSGGGIFQTGSVQTISVLSSITLNGETLFGSASVFRDNILWNTDATIPPYSFTYNDTNISSSQTYQTFVQTNNNGSPTIINSNTTTANFIFPYLCGLSTTSGLSGTTLYSGLTNGFPPSSTSPIISTQANQTVNLVGYGVYIYFAYPSSYPNLTSILDPNLFEIISSFNVSTVSVTSVGLTYNWTTNYTVYQTQLISGPDGNFQFIY